MLSLEETLNDAVVEAVLESGHSRIPVHRGTDRHDIVGLVLVKELLSAVRQRGQVRGDLGRAGDVARAGCLDATAWRYGGRSGAVVGAAVVIA